MCTVVFTKNSIQYLNLPNLIMSKVYNWFNERLEIQSIADDVTSKYVPPHVNIFYCLGGITLTCFIVQVATGFAMTFYYRPTVAEAFASVQFIMTEVNFGWLIRSVHRWSASMMVLMMILHVFRVYLTGGFKKPRELTWVTGVILASVTEAPVAKLTCLDNLSPPTVAEPPSAVALPLIVIEGLASAEFGIEASLALGNVPVVKAEASLLAGTLSNLPNLTSPLESNKSANSLALLIFYLVL